MKSIYFCRDNPDEPWGFTVSPDRASGFVQLEFSNLEAVQLRDIDSWNENLVASIIRKCCAWTDFLGPSRTLFAAEIQMSDLAQRVDILTIDRNGAVLPWELKIGTMDSDRDVHGQLLRYMADIHYMSDFGGHCLTRREQFVERFDLDVGRRMINLMNAFLHGNDLSLDQAQPTSKAGVLLCEAFPAQTLRAVSYLNSVCGLNIQLVGISAYRGEESFTNRFGTEVNCQTMRIDFESAQDQLQVQQ